MEARGIPLEEYTKQCPPGWAPHTPGYPFKTYLDKVHLWQMMTDVELAKQGPTLIGRLKGAAYRVALKLVVTCDEMPSDLTKAAKTLSGVEALCYCPPDDQTAGTLYCYNRARQTPGTDHDTAKAAVTTADLARAVAEKVKLRLSLPSAAATQLLKQSGWLNGVEAMLDTLAVAYGEEEVDSISTILDKFLNLSRGSGNLVDYCIAFKNRYDAAQYKANLQINDVGLTHMFLHKAGLSQKFIDDILLKVDGDRSRYNDIYSHIFKVAKAHQQYPDEAAGHILLVDESQDYYDDDEQQYSNVEYLTDAQGAWYIWDYD